MHVLFIHPNYPGQFIRLANTLAREPGFTVQGVGDAAQVKLDAIPVNHPVLTYPAPGEASDRVHPLSRRFDLAVRRGQQIVSTLLAHKRQGLEPDLIFAHPGWGDSFFLKDIFPGATIVGLFEYFYRRRGADVGFDPEFPMNFDDIFRIRTLNAPQLLALESCDIGFCPTAFQRSCFPAPYQPRLQVIHDGIDTGNLVPDPLAVLELPDGSVHRAGEEILTFVSRNLEPYRGYHIFMRALPAILRARPHCKVIIVGGDNVGYGKAPPPGQTWRQRYFDEVAGQLDTSRVHFTGSIPYASFVKVLQVSRAHVYLSYPFVLSWSMLEAMSAGCLVIGSDTAPVKEVISHGHNGLLVPFFNPAALARSAIEALQTPERFAPLRQAARHTAVTRYDFASVSYPAFKHLIASVQ